MAARVLVLGLDVGDGALVRAWAEQGRLPVLASLISSGSWRWLSSTVEALHVSTWPSLYTGTEPGQHGVYYTFQPRPRHQGVLRFGADQYGQPPFWQLLSEAGKRCVVLDAPYAHPHAAFDGVQIFDWGTWAHYWRPMAVPEGFDRKFAAACGGSPIGLEANQVGLGPLDLPDLRRRLLRAAALKARAARWLMSQGAWDLFFVVFGESHPAAHYFWSAEGAAGEPGALLRDVYEAIDRGIGDILTDIGTDTRVFVVSGDGVGPNRAGWHLLPEVLRRLGFTAGAERQPRMAVGAGRHEAGKSLLKRVRDAVPQDIRRAVSRRLPSGWRDSLTSRWLTADIDWTRTRAFCLPTDLEGVIRVNLKGREPLGIVERGKPYEDVCRELAGTLGRLVNPRTGRPAVRQVVRADTSLPGDRRENLPDLIVLWSDEAVIDELQSPEVGTVHGVSPDVRTGTHRSPGFVLAHGPGIAGGGPAGTGRLIDFGPTILAQLGVRPTAAMTGQIWSDLCPN